MSLNPPTLGFLLHDVARLLRKRFEQRARDIGLTRSQWQTLAYLSRNEGIHQSGLAELLEIEPITLMRVLEKLTERGFIARKRHETDRRICLLYTTEEARALLSDMRAIGDATRSEALDGISDDDRDRLVIILDLMKSNLLQACRAPADKETHHG
ncbi:DNA-binding MarR family transcriptional regulator [Pararhizobium capsulatum DSM 1112]|uniref:DNA-binding MarR family transcriptional regulator n=1 Tax=Pararhizobium capsulatum DSM 1112 TaxID=1121113 RepID=A0ABU0BJB1_9HYPH|nr:MarR family transcriptional regulator [Pararhizobium capsulatum]MDQ0318341.1 DNA-binding MarR family transcriptional regulator [Pararhizobium capsulatum DSM 1112]